jgi:hypothetical protein
MTLWLLTDPNKKMLNLFQENFIKIKKFKTPEKS